MSVCQTTPTATQFATVTTDSVSTSSSASVTTVPASVTTITTSSCSAVSSGVSAGCETTTIVSTISPEQVVTTQVPVDVTVPVTLTSATATLFGTSCTTTGGGGGGGVISTPPPSSTSSSTSSSISTLPPSTSQTVIQSSSTLPGGSVVVVSSTLTTVVTPTTLVPVTNNRSSSSNVGAIVGGTVGGVAFLAILFLAIFFCIRKRHKDRDDDFDHVDGKINPFPIRLHRNNKKAQNMTIDEPDPFNANGSSNFAANPAPEANLAGVGAGAAGIGAASAVGAASDGPRRTPSATTGSFPNPYSVAPSSVDEPQRNGPPGPMSDGSVVSESIYSQQSRFPQALHVANPSEYPPIGNVQPSRQPPSMPMPMPEVSDPSAYGNSSDGGASTAQAGTSFAPYVHQDAGRAEPGRSTKAAEARRDAEEEPGHVFPPPPAYEE